MERRLQYPSVGRDWSFAWSAETRPLHGTSMLRSSVAPPTFVMATRFVFTVGVGGSASIR